VKPRVFRNEVYGSVFVVRDSRVFPYELLVYDTHYRRAAAVVTSHRLPSPALTP
jgi:hypothetical protein